MAISRYKGTEVSGHLFLYVRPEYSHNRDDVKLTERKVYGYSFVK